MQSSPNSSVRLAVVSALLLPIVSLGCSGELDPGGVQGAQGIAANGTGAGRKVTTVLSAAKSAAGVTITATCQEGDTPLASASVTLQPASGATLNAKGGGVFGLTGKATGPYTVTCRDGLAVDAAPPTWTVTTGPIVRSVAAVAPGTFAAGAEAKVACTGYDAFDNATVTAGWILAVKPAERAQALPDLTLKGGVPGPGKVACTLADLTEAKATLALFTVQMGAPAKIVTQAPAGVVGQSVQVTCALQDAAGNAIEPPPGEWSLVAAVPLLQPGPGGGPLTVSSKKTGAFPVTCALTGHASLQAEKATVTFGPGAAAKVIATVAPKTLIAGEGAAAVTCSVQDGFGNPTSFPALPGPGAAAPPALVTVVEVGDDLKLDGSNVSGKKAGAHDVRCASPPLKLQQVAAVLTITPAKPAYSKAILKPAKAIAGSSVAVSCSAFDEFHNAVVQQPAPWQIAADGGCTVANGQVTCTKAGPHAVTCAHADVPEAVPATLDVEPGPPETMALTLVPSLKNYTTWQKISVLAKGADAYGNALPDIALGALTAAPAADSKIDVLNQIVSFGEDGKYTLTGTAKANPKLKATAQVKVDSHGPLVLVSTPKRASTLTHAPTVAVSFTALDELSALGEVTVNGKAMAGGSGMGLKATVTAKQGLNLLHVTAKDEWGHARSVVQSFQSTATYRPISSLESKKGLVPGGLDAWLGQPVIDSGVHIHSKPRDFATVFEIVLKGLDLKSLLGAGFPIDKFGLKGTATIKSFTFGDPAFNGGYPKVTLTAIDGGMTLAGSIKKVKATVNINGKELGLIPVNIDASLTASTLEFGGTVLVSVDAAGKVTVVTKNVTVNLTNLDVNVDNSWGWLVNWLIDLFNNQVTTLLEDTVASALSTAISGPLANVLQSFALDTAFTVPGFLGGKPATLQLASVLQGLQFSGKKGTVPGGARITLKAAASSKLAVSHKIQGAYARSGCLAGADPSAALKKASPFEIALHLDVMNQLLAAIWQTGAFQIAIDPTQFSPVDLSKYGVTNLSVKADPLLPPILVDCTGDGKPELQLGDLGLDVTMKLGGVPVQMKVYVQVMTEVALQAVPGVGGLELGLKVQKPYLLEADVDSVIVEGNVAGGAMAALLEEVLLPVVTGKLLEGFAGTLASFPLPAIDLSLMSALIPKGTVIALDLQQATHGPGHAYGAGGVKK